jgi:hypothetical protein
MNKYAWVYANPDAPYCVAMTLSEVEFYKYQIERLVKQYPFGQSIIAVYRVKHFLCEELLKLEIVCHTYEVEKKQLDFVKQLRQMQKT